MERRRAQIEESVARYLQQLDTADRHEPSDVLAAKTTRLKEKIAKLKEEIGRLATIEARMLATPDQQISLMGGRTVEVDRNENARATVTLDVRGLGEEDEEIELVEFEMDITVLDVDLGDVNVFEPEDYDE